MRRLPVNLAFAMLMSLWLGICVPGHHQIVAALPAADSHHHHNQHDHDRDHETTHDSSHCSVCLFASSLSMPVDLTPSVAGPELLAILSDGQPPQVVIADRIPAFFGRGPPISA